MKTALGRTPPLDIREVFVSVPLDKRGALVKVETELMRCISRDAPYGAPSLHMGSAHRQDKKGTRWMPWHLESMKGVDGCDKPR